ncbi:MAG: DUF2059 domain-containing protein [Steroidobacterales bacterium]|jgi:hypothetical protein
MRTLLITVLMLLAAPVLAQQAPPSDASLHQLFAAIHVNRLLDSYVTQVDAGMQAGMRAALNGKTPTPRQQQIIDGMRTRMIGVFRETLSWEKLEPMMTDIYREDFTQREVDDMLKFYRSPSGVSVIDKIPLAMQQAGQRVQSMLPPMLEKIQQIQKDSVAQLKAASDAGDAAPAGAPAPGPPPPPPASSPATSQPQ